VWFDYRTNPAINLFGGLSPAVITFYMQCWVGIAFGADVLFYPLLIAGVVRAARRDALLVEATVVAPFVTFAIYWGSFASGLAREGLQAWIEGVVIICVWAWTTRGTPRWLGTWWSRVLFASRGSKPS
jgi:hypothetical protein